MITCPPEKVSSQLIEFIQNMFPGAGSCELSNDDKLLEMGIVDSLGVLEIVTFIQTTYAITVKDEEITGDNFDTISNITTYVTSKMS
jgi:acyl carrier protein